MNRLKLCDDFLKSVGSIAEEKDINEDNIYHMLVNLGVPLEYQRIETSQLFPYWILQFKDIENIEDRLGLIAAIKKLVMSDINDG